MRFTKSILLAFIFIFTTGFLFKGCEPDTNSPDEQVSEQTGQMMAEANRQVGMPNINNWQEKKLVRDLYELRDQEDLLTYTYIINWEGQKIYLGRSIGYGIPASVQYSNPERMVHDSGVNGRSAAFTKQPEPNGLFMPDGLSATWVFLVDENGNPRATYVEPPILVSPVQLH